MADIIDIADRTATRFLDNGLARHRARRAAEAARPVNLSGLCRDCEEPIEAPRLQAQPTATRCVSCQCDHERRMGRY